MLYDILNFTIPVNYCIADRNNNHTAEEADDGNKVEWVSDR